MTGPNPLDSLRIPFDILESLDNRTLHFWLQPVHYLVRALHVLAVAAFFGAIAALDLRLVGFGRRLAADALAALVRPWLYATFAVSVATGVVLFLYDPVEVGSHPYFVPKLALIALGALNALAFHRVQLTGEAAMAITRRAGMISLLLWTAVILLACLNAEPPPRVFLR